MFSSSGLSGMPVSSINNTDHHDIAEILLKAALNTINQELDLLDFKILKWCLVPSRNPSSCDMSTMI